MGTAPGGIGGLFLLGCEVRGGPIPLRRHWFHGRHDGNRVWGYL